jgi:hypothetical protein
VEIGWLDEAREAIDLELKHPQPHPQITDLQARLGQIQSARDKPKQQRTWSSS